LRSQVHCPASICPKDNGSACLALSVASGTADDMVIESDAKHHPGTGSMPSERQHLRRLACRSGPAVLPRTVQSRLRRRSDDGHAIFAILPGQALKTVVSRGLARG
jgi:hypothetical protein